MKQFLIPTLLSVSILTLDAHAGKGKKDIATSDTGRPRAAQASPHQDDQALTPDRQPSQSLSLSQEPAAAEAAAGNSEQPIAEASPAPATASQSPGGARIAHAQRDERIRFLERFWAQERPGRAIREWALDNGRFIEGDIESEYRYALLFERHNSPKPDA